MWLRKECYINLKKWDKNTTICTTDNEKNDIIVGLLQINPYLYNVLEMFDLFQH